ncbi:MAG: hypothetical protein AAF696_16325 [Bacteroidota bacterium]
MAFLIFSTAGLSSCETLKEDMLPEVLEVEVIDMYALSGTPTIVDLMQGVNTTENTSIEMIEMPDLGEIENLGTNFSLYTPPTSRAEGQTTFSWEVSINDKVFRRKANMIIASRSRYPISGGPAIYDRGGILAQGDSLVADILTNDLLPNGLSSVSSLQIVQAPIAGIAEITTDLKLAFIAPADTTGLIDVLYRLETTDGSNGVAAARFLVQ